MIIKESAENYLETIYMLNKQRGFARSIDISNELGVSKPSVSVAMKNFREAGYIETDPDGKITLTKKGLEVAERVYERHQVVAKALIALGVDEETAFEDSCKIEHDISQKTFEKIKDFLLRNGKL
ncbi:MAG: metal-dependent transcriptional regulator [Clostridia bacterium]|nr:metal-dependent transcriptional regulator [Clostridia bacterium]